MVTLLASCAAAFYIHTGSVQNQYVKTDFSFTYPDSLQTAKQDNVKIPPLGSAVLTYRKLKEIAISDGHVIALPPVDNAFGKKWEDLDRFVLYRKTNEALLSGLGLTFHKTSDIWYPELDEGSVTWIPEISPAEYRLYLNSLIEALRPAEISINSFRPAPDGTCPALSKVAQALQLSDQESEPVAANSLAGGDQLSILNVINAIEAGDILETVKACANNLSHISDGQLGFATKEKGSVFGFAYSSSTSKQQNSSNLPEQSVFPIQKSINYFLQPSIKTNYISPLDSLDREFINDQFTIGSLAKLVANKELAPIKIDIDPCLADKRVIIFGTLNGKEYQTLANVCEMYNLSLVRDAATITISPFIPKFEINTSLADRCVLVRHFLPSSAYKMLDLFDEKYFIGESILTKAQHNSDEKNSFKNWGYLFNGKIDQTNTVSSKHIYSFYAKNNNTITRIPTANLPESIQNRLSFLLVEPVLRHITSESADPHFSLSGAYDNIYLQGRIEFKEKRTFIHLSFLVKNGNGQLLKRTALEEFPINIK